MVNNLNTTAAFKDLSIQFAENTVQQLACRNAVTQSKIGLLCDDEVNNILEYTDLETAYKARACCKRFFEAYPVSHHSERVSKSVKLVMDDIRNNFAKLFFSFVKKEAILSPFTNKILSDEMDEKVLGARRYNVAKEAQSGHIMLEGGTHQYKPTNIFGLNATHTGYERQNELDIQLIAHLSNADVIKALGQLSVWKHKAVATSTALSTISGLFCKACALKVKSFFQDYDTSRRLRERLAGEAWNYFWNGEGKEIDRIYQRFADDLLKSLVNQGKAFQIGEDTSYRNGNGVSNKPQNVRFFINYVLHELNKDDRSSGPVIEDITDQEGQ